MFEGKAWSVISDDRGGESINCNPRVWRHRRSGPSDLKPYCYHLSAPYQVRSNNRAYLFLLHSLSKVSVTRSPSCPFGDCFPPHSINARMYMWSQSSPAADGKHFLRWANDDYHHDRSIPRSDLPATPLLEIRI